MQILFESLRHGTRFLRAQTGFLPLWSCWPSDWASARTVRSSPSSTAALRPLPYRNTTELVEISVPQNGPPLEVLQTARSFSGVAAFVTWGFHVENPQGAVNTYGFYVSPNLFSVLGVEAAVGRIFSPDENQPVIMLGYDYWRRTSGDPRIVGQSLKFQASPTPCWRPARGILSLGTRRQRIRPR